MKFRFPKTVVNIDAVDAKFRPLYEDDGSGTFQLVDDPRVNAAIEACRGAFGALDAERAAHEALQRTVPDLTPLAEYGDDVTTIAATLQERLTKAAKKATKDGVNVEDAVNQAREQWGREHKDANEKRDNREQGLTTQLEKLLVDSAVDRCVDGIKPTNAGREFFRMKMKAGIRTKLTDDHQLAVTIVDDKGNQRYSGGDGPGGAMTMTELASELSANTDYAPYIQSDTPAGGGTPPGGAPQGRTLVGGSQRPLSAVEKIAKGIREGQHRQT